MKKQAGFTLIELVMVIVILGILAAVALPKFVNLGTDARTAAVKGVEGSMRSTNAIIYAKAAVVNKMTQTSILLQSEIPGAINDVTVRYGYAVNATNIAFVMDLSPDFDANPSGASNMQIQHKGAQNPATCGITYTAALETGAPPTYSATYSGC